MVQVLSSSTARVGPQGESLNVAGCLVGKQQDDGRVRRRGPLNAQKQGQAGGIKATVASCNSDRGPTMAGAAQAAN